jgi:hypothetical protein
MLHTHNDHISITVELLHPDGSRPNVHCFPILSESGRIMGTLAPSPLHPAEPYTLTLASGESLHPHLPGSHASVNSSVRLITLPAAIPA